MLVRHPEDWPRAFVKCLNAGDIDGVLGLYESHAQFITPTRDVIKGRERIRAFIERLITGHAEMECEVVQCLVMDDVAQLYTDFSGTVQDEHGRSRTMRDHAIEVLRRQADGGWQLIAGDPNGRSTRGQA